MNGLIVVFVLIVSWFKYLRLFVWIVLLCLLVLLMSNWVVFELNSLKCIVLFDVVGVVREKVIFVVMLLFICRFIGVVLVK